MRLEALPPDLRQAMKAEIRPRAAHAKFDAVAQRAWDDFERDRAQIVAKYEAQAQVQVRREAA